MQGEKSWGLKVDLDWRRMMTDDKLKPCPFCGDTMPVYESHAAGYERNTSCFECHTCDMRGPLAYEYDAEDRLQQTRKLWNTRQEADIEALKAENLKLHQACRLALNSLRGAPKDCLGIRGGIEQGVRQWYVRDAIIRRLEAALGE